MRMWIFLAVALAACSKSAPDCAKAVSSAVDRLVEDARPKMTAAAAANVERVAPKMKQVITEACVQDKWAPGVITCIAHAKSQHELNDCDKQLTPAQRASEHKRQDEILKIAVMPLELPPKAGSAAMGSASATGSGAP
jgi:hypothetical protein